MKDLEQYIKNTTLFTAEEKIEILADLKNYTSTEKEELQKAIDDYEDSVTSLIDTHFLDMEEELHELENSEKDTDKKAEYAVTATLLSLIRKERTKQGK